MQNSHDFNTSDAGPDPIHNDIGRLGNHQLTRTRNPPQPSQFRITGEKAHLISNAMDCASAADALSLAM